MKIIIDIPNSLYANLSKMANGSIACKRILDCVKNGTPLPKGHGRLIDVSEYFKKDFGDAREFLDKATTIIDADKESDS